MSAGEWLQRQCIVFVSVGSCESKMGWNKWSRARRPPTKHHYKQLRKYYAFGVTRNTGRGAQVTQAYNRLHFGHKVILLSLVCHDFYFASMFKRCVYYARTVCFHPRFPPLFSLEDFWTINASKHGSGGGHNNKRSHTIQVWPNTEHKN